MATHKNTIDPRSYEHHASVIRVIEERCRLYRRSYKDQINEIINNHDLGMLRDYLIIQFMLKNEKDMLDGGAPVYNNPIPDDIVNERIYCALSHMFNFYDFHKYHQTEKMCLVFIERYKNYMPLDYIVRHIVIEHTPAIRKEINRIKLIGVGNLDVN